MNATSSAEALRDPGSNATVHIARTLLLLSGASALIYQTLWIKQLSLVVGVDVYAITTGVSAFFAGLALGSVLFGRLADRLDRPLRLYAWLEVAIAFAGVSTTLLLTRAPPWFVALEGTVGLLAWALPFILVAVPATFMGGTLPPLLAALRPGSEAIGRHSGRLYAANTAGAILGALATIFLIVPAFGIRGASGFAAALNLALALAAWIVLPRFRAGTPVVGEAPPDRHASAGDEAASAAAGHTHDARLALGLYGLAGAVAIGYEVVWTQVVVQFLSTRAMAFGIVLATYLTGLVIGSWLFARWADRIAHRWRAFGYLIAGAGIAAMGTFLLLGPWLPAAQDTLGETLRDLTGSRTLEMAGRFLLATGFLILPATVLLGAAFPAATRLIVRGNHAGRDVGSVLALNTALGILGTGVTGFVLIPAAGLAGALGVLAVVAALIGAVALARESNFQAGALRVALPLVLAVATVAWLLPRDRLATLLADTRGGEVVFYDEGPAGTVAVLEQQAGGDSFRRLYIQGVSNSGDVMPSQRYMRLQALLPLVIHAGEPRSAMVIAFGTGITAGSLLMYPDLERRAAVELLQPVIDAAPLFNGNVGAGRDPRLEVIIADGRHELMRSPESWDLITLEPPPPAAAGVVNLYSREFYELAAKRLNESGLLAQWLPIATQNTEDSRSLVRSMLDVFPHVTLWTTEFHETLLVGSMAPIVLDYERIEQRMAIPSVRDALTAVGIDSAAGLLATYLTDRAGLERFVAGAAPVTDDDPRIEYAAWVRPREILRVLPELLELASPVPVTASEAQHREIEIAFMDLLDFYEMAYLSYGDAAQRWSARTREVRAQAPRNAYYDWYFLLR